MQKSFCCESYNAAVVSFVFFFVSLVLFLVVFVFASCVFVFGVLLFSGIVMA